MCNHAVGEMEDYVKAALKKGLQQITFLEHLEVGIIHPERIWLTDDDFDYYFSEGKRLKKKYNNLIKIVLGIEAGFNPFEISTLNHLLQSYPCEHVGLSYHFLFNGSRHLNMLSSRQKNLIGLMEMGVDKVITSYFTGLLQGIKYLNVQVLCHLDGVLRYVPEITFSENHWKQIELILDAAVDKGIALEINTSGYGIRQEPYPEKKILELARQRNLNFIAGSDAHHPNQVGRFFSDIPSLFS